MKQIFRVGAMLRPLQTPEEIQASFRQMKTVAYLGYAITVLLCGGWAAILFSISSVTNVGVYLAWASAVVAAALLLAAPFLKPRVDGFLLKLSGAAAIPASQPPEQVTPKTKGGRS